MIELTDAQKHAMEVIANADKPIAWLGGIRGGKTFGSVYGMLERMREYPGQYIIGSWTYGNIERNIFPHFDHICSELGIHKKYKQSFPRELIFKDLDSSAFLFPAQDSESQKSLQGMTARGAFLDEVLLLPQSFVMQTIARLSVDPPMLLMTANKSAPNHWIKTNWIDKGKVIELNTDTSENPHISKTSLTWYDTLLEGHYKDSMLNNEWSSEYNAVLGIPEFYTKLPKRNSLTRDFQCAYLTYGRDCCVLIGSQRGSWYYIEDIFEGSANQCIEKMSSKYNGLHIASITETDLPFGFEAHKPDFEAWAEAISKFSVDNFKISKKLADKICDLGAWVYKGDNKVDEISTFVLSYALLVHRFRQSAKPFTIGKLL